MRNRRSIVMLALSALVAGFLGTASPALADDPTPLGLGPDGTVTLSGMIDAPAGALVGASVSLLVKDSYCVPDVNGNQQCGDQWLLMNGADVNPTTGAYSIAAGPNQVVRLLAQGPAFFDNAYGHTAAAENVDVTSGSDITVTDADISGLDISVTAKPAITGTITFPEGSLISPIPGDTQSVIATIHAYWKVTKGSYTGWVPETIDVPLDAATSSFSYRVPVSRTGTYRVSVSGYWLKETFFGGDSLDSATDVAVDSTGAAGIDIAPALSPQISGKLIAPEGYALEAFAPVVAVRFGPDGNPIGQTDADLSFAFADANGDYRIPVSAGTWAVLVMGKRMFGFAGTEPACFATQGFDSGCSPGTFTVNDFAGVQGLDITLRLFPRIQGTITLPDGVTASDVSVSAEGWTGSAGEDCFECGWQQSTTGDISDNGDGTASYTVWLNNPGTYRVVFTGAMVETLKVGGTDGPDPDAVTSTFTSADVVRDVTLSAKAVIHGSINPDILQGEIESAWVNAVPCDVGDIDSEVQAEIDLATLEFDLPVPSGCYYLSVGWYTMVNGEEVLNNSWYPGANAVSDSSITIGKGARTTVYLQALAPAAPSNALVAAVAEGQVSVTWDAPAFDGGTPITGYTVTAVDPETNEPTGQSCTAAADETLCTVSGLDNLREYRFTVTTDTALASSDTAVTEIAVPHDDTFQVWVPKGNVERDTSATVWVLGATGYDSVAVKIGNATFDVAPGITGDASFSYFADSADRSVQGGKLRIVARASRINDSGHRERVMARTTMYVPKFTLRASWKAGSTIVARVSALQPGSTVAFVLDGDTFACDAQADASGRTSCAFDAPAAGSHTLEAATQDFIIDYKEFTVKPAKRV